jgi:hypothetical protein
METVTVQLLNQKALKLLKQLEELNLIKVTENETPKPEKLSDQFQGKLSDRFYGKLSDKTAKALQKHVKKGRDEWERDI